MFGLKFEVFWFVCLFSFHCFQLYEVKPCAHILMVRYGVLHRKCHMDIVNNGLELVFQNHICSGVYLHAKSFWLLESSPQETALVPRHTVYTTLMICFFFCIVTDNKDGITFLSILSSWYVPLSANFHSYKDIFRREVFSWSNFRDKQMAIGLWRCYWIVTAGSKVLAEKSTVWLLYPKLSYQHWQLRKRKEYISFLLVKWSHLTQSPWKLHVWNDMFWLL